MEQELWISFRIRLLDFQDFYEKWSSKLKTLKKASISTPEANKEIQKSDAVIVHLEHEIKEFEEIWPLLRCITGDLFETEHWNLLFYKLSMSKSTNLRNLTFGNLLQCRQAMIRNADSLKQLASRAQGEVTIREAIQELRAWTENEEFQFASDESMEVCKAQGMV